VNSRGNLQSLLTKTSPYWTAPPGQSSGSSKGEIVIGVWQDLAEPCGIGFLVLKGRKLLESIASNQSITARLSRLSVIPRECHEQAIAAKQVFGTRDYDA
jgi:hypothetical protein